MHSERAQVGLLSIAARQLGHYPLLEFIQEKRNESGYGFQDLEIMTANQIWNIEAKYLRINFNDEDFQYTVTSKMKEAVTDLLKIKRPKNIPIQKRVAIVFVSPDGVSEASKDCLAFSSNLQRAVKRWPKTGFFVTHFCSRGNWTQSCHHDSPGIAILGRQL